MLTDGQGHFEFPLPKDEPNSDTNFEVLSPLLSSNGKAGHQFWLSARKPGFLDDPGDRIEASAGSETTIPLLPEALIKGRVSLSASDSALGIAVQIFSRQVVDGFPRWMPGTSVTTNSAGEFRFAELHPGAYKLVTHEWLDSDPADTGPGGQLYGFPPVYYPGVTDFAGASAIELVAGQTVEADFSLTRQAYYRVKIPLANAEAIAGANISVQKEGGGPGYSLGYNLGNRQIEGLLPNGNYVVAASTFAPNSLTGEVNLKVAGVAAEGPTMALAATSSITLDVKEEFTSNSWIGESNYFDGKRTVTFRRGARSYLQARVEPVDELMQLRNGVIRPPKGPNDDSMVIEDLVPGRYWLLLNTNRGYVASATMGGVDLLHQPLVVGSGASTPIEITMRDDGAELDATLANLAAPSPTAGGFVTAAFPPPQAWLYCVPLPDSPGQFQQLGVSPEGTFTSQMMAPGGYRVLAFAKPQPNLAYRDAEAMGAYENKGQVIHLAAGQKAAIQVSIIPADD
jgi:hypothetical protein